LVLCFALSGCAGGNLRSQALRPSDSDLSRLQNNLGLLVVTIHPVYANIQVRSIVLQHQSSKERHVISFFNNAILGSHSVPFTRRDGGIEQVLLLDLPAGKYLLKAFGFALQSDSGAYTEIMRNEVSEKLELEVRDGHSSYFGDLDIEVTGVTVHGTFGDREVAFPPTEPVKLYTLTTTTGHLNYTVSDLHASNVAAAREQYPTLANVSFVTSIILTE
jgi:hypothetical protein